MLKYHFAWNTARVTWGLPEYVKKPVKTLIFSGKEEKNAYF
jgi:hypothetical protein